MAIVILETADTSKPAAFRNRGAVSPQRLKPFSTTDRRVCRAMSQNKQRRVAAADHGLESRSAAVEAGRATCDCTPRGRQSGMNTYRRRCSRNRHEECFQHTRSSSSNPSTLSVAMIVEVACVRLESKGLPRERKLFLHDAPYQKRQAALRFTLTQGIRVLSRVSKHTFHLLQDTEDPFLVYYIGRWRSLACYTSFRTSPERQELISALQRCEASLAWHEISNAKYSRPRNVALRMLHGQADIFAAPLVGIARCHAGDGWVSGGGMDVEWVLSCTRKNPAHMSLVGNMPLVEFWKDVLRSNTLNHGGKGNDRVCLVIGEWSPGERKRIWKRGDCSQARCADIDLRIVSPIHLH